MSGSVAVEEIIILVLLYFGHRTWLYQAVFRLQKFDSLESKGSTIAKKSLVLFIILVHIYSVNAKRKYIGSLHATSTKESI